MNDSPQYTTQHTSHYTAVSHYCSALLATCLLVCCLTGSAQASIPPGFDPISAYGPVATYTIARNGKKIGKHQISFSKPVGNPAAGAAHDILLVNVQTNLKVTLFGIPLYRFDYMSQEKWASGQLQAVKARTTEKGVTTTVSMQRDGSRMQLLDKSSVLSRQEVEHSSNHWNPAVLSASRLFNTLSGKANNVNIIKAGVETLQIAGIPQSATRYRYTGELRVDVWYDEQQRWVKLAFKADDGSSITYLSEGFGNQ